MILIHLFYPWIQHILYEAAGADDDVSVCVDVGVVLSDLGVVGLVWLTVAVGQLGGGGGLAQPGAVAAVVVTSYGAAVALLGGQTGDVLVVIRTGQRSPGITTGQNILLTPGSLPLLKMTGLCSVVGDSIQSLPIFFSLDTSLCCLSKLGRALEKCDILVDIVLRLLVDDLDVVIVSVTVVPDARRDLGLHCGHLCLPCLCLLADFLHRVGPSQHAVPNF